MDPGEGGPIWPALALFRESQLGLCSLLLHKLVRPGLRWEQEVGELVQVRAAVLQGFWSWDRRQDALKLPLGVCRARCSRRRHLLHMLNTSLQDSRPSHPLAVLIERAFLRA